MDLRQLHYFVTLADTLNFHRAAERLNMSQPPLTVSIRRLEEELGAKLFDRGSRGVRLTAEGEAALRPAREALTRVEMVREAVRRGGLGETGRLTVGFVGSAISECLPRIVPFFRTRFPDVELVLQEMTTAAIAQAVEARQLDAGLVRLPVMSRARLEIAVIEADVLFVALPTSHPQAHRKLLRLEDLAKEHFVLNSPVSVLHTVVHLACQKAGFKPLVAQEATQLQTVLCLVQSGLGVALVPSRMARLAPKGVTMLPLSVEVTTEMGIVCRNDAGPLQRNFITAGLDADSQLVSM